MQLCTNPVEHIKAEFIETYTLELVGKEEKPVIDVWKFPKKLKENFVIQLHIIAHQLISICT